MTLLSPEAQRTATAFAEMARVLREVEPQLGRLARRCGDLEAATAAGAELAEVIAGEERPLVITALTEIVDVLVEAAGEVRRAEAAQLRAAGLTQDSVARLLGVTRQRAAALLSAAALGPPRRSPKRRVVPPRA